MPGDPILAPLAPPAAVAFSQPFSMAPAGGLDAVRLAFSVRKIGLSDGTSFDPSSRVREQVRAVGRKPPKSRNHLARIGAKRSSWPNNSMAWGRAPMAKESTLAEPDDDADLLR